MLLHHPRVKKSSTPPPPSAKRIFKVALLVETSNAYARGILAGVEDYIKNHGPWNVYLAEHGRGDLPPKWLQGWDGDGILARVENANIAKVLASATQPVVDLSSRRLLPEVPAVTTHNGAIAQLAVQHFVERGFTQLAFCGDERFGWSQDRCQHFIEICRQRSIPCCTYKSVATLTSDGDPETEAIAAWLLTLPKPIGVFACYDARGQQVLDACRRAGVAVPEEVAVLGVDNDELLCALSPPPLSSIMPNPKRTGWTAASLLHQKMRGESVPPDIVYIEPLGLAARQSTDTLAVDDPQIARALRFIREHACDGIGVGEVLQACPMGRRSLEHRMKKIINRSPHEEIFRVRINLAKDLLAGTKLKISEIADRCGFANVEYLSGAFRRATMMSPSGYRKAYGPQEGA
jgi:LacI family transcriptional regulator